MSESTDLTALPSNLPVPGDDGAANHLQGIELPGLALPATDGSSVDLSKLEGRTILYVFPMMGRPGVALPEGWNELPGARGCTVQSLTYSKNLSDLEEMGVRVFGMSRQDIGDLQEAKERLGLKQTLLSDEAGRAQEALRLPTFEIEGNTYLRRLTLGLVDGKVERIWYPVFPPGQDVDEVRVWSRE